MRNNLLVTSIGRFRFIFFLVTSLLAVIMEAASLGVIIPLFSLYSDYINTGNYPNIPLLDDILNSLSSDELIIYFLFLFLMMYMIKTIYMIFFSRFKASIIFKIDTVLSQKMLVKYLGYDFLSFKMEHSGFKARDVVGEVGVARNYYMSLFNVLIDFFTFLTILSILLLNDFLNTIISFSVITLSLIAVNALLRKTQYSIGSQRKLYEQKRLVHVQTYFNLLSYIQVNSLSNLVSEKFWKLNSELEKVMAKNDFYKNFPKYILEFLGVLTIVFYVYLAFESGLTVEEILSKTTLFVVGLVKLLPLTNRLSQAYGQMQFSKISVETVKTVLSKVDHSKNIQLLNEVLEIDNLTISSLEYSYPNQQGFLLKKDEIALSERGIYLLKSISGKGKTTLINILLGLIEPNKGELLINGKNYPITNLKGLRPLISYFPQETCLIDTSVEENLEFSRNFDRRTAHHLLDKFQLSSKIGFETLVGENGNNLSGGQKQRICLIRTLSKIKVGGLIILDEPFNNLDAESINNVVSYLNSISSDNIILMTSHQEPENLLIKSIIEL